MQDSRAALEKEKAEAKEAMQAALKEAEEAEVARTKFKKEQRELDAMQQANSSSVALDEARIRVAKSRIIGFEQSLQAYRGTSVEVHILENLSEELHAAGQAVAAVLRKAEARTKLRRLLDIAPEAKRTGGAHSGSLERGGSHGGHELMQILSASTNAPHLQQRMWQD